MLGIWFSLFMPLSGTSFASAEYSQHLSLTFAKIISWVLSTRGVWSVVFQRNLTSERVKAQFLLQLAQAFVTEQWYPRVQGTLENIDLMTSSFLHHPQYLGPWHALKGTQVDPPPCAASQGASWAPDSVCLAQQVLNNSSEAECPTQQPAAECVSLACKVGR